MPTYERRKHLRLFMTEIEKRNEMEEESRATSTSGKGKRTQSVSGDALKTKIRNGEVN